MSDTTDLHAQIAQRLFGWDDHDGLWGEPGGDGEWELHVTPPAYTTDPAATAQVWQWVEESQSASVESIAFEYYRGSGKLVCLITCTMRPSPIEGTAPTWPEALCRAALALADALEQAEDTP